MVIQIIIHDGINTRTRTHRDIVLARGDLTRLREGFEAQAAFSKWGEMVQLKGKERIILAKFGRLE
jgi:hypothetical protein